MANNQLISLTEAASLLDVSTATLRNWDKKGHLKAIRNPVNRYRMYMLSDVLTLKQRAFTLAPLETPSDQESSGIRRTPSSGDVRRLVRALHTILRDYEGNSSLIERFDELTKIIYCKLHDERDSGSSPRETVFRITPGDTDQSVAIRIRMTFDSLVERRPDLFPEKFRLLNVGDSTIRRIVEQLSGIELSSVSEDIKGLFYEEIIRNTFDKGDNQQFFTPRPIVEFMVQALDLYLNGSICDPACGTGGFLLYVERYLKQIRSPADVELIGYEIDERLAWVAGVNLDMHDPSYQFSVSRLPSAGSLGNDLKPHFGSVDTIITNPPFGSTLSAQESLNEFELGRGRASRRRGVLFIERCLELLKPGGIVAIIIDDGVLNSPSNTDTRLMILERSRPLAIISLPDTAFMPYASVKASILLLQKKTGTTSDEKPYVTFFAHAEKVGRKANGEPLLHHDKSTGKLELKSDLRRILTEWKAGPSDTHPQASWSEQQYFWATLPVTDDEAFAKDGLRIDPAYHDPARARAEGVLHSSKYPLRSVLEICDVRNEAAVPSTHLQDEEIRYVGLANIEAHTGIYTPTLVSGSSLRSSVKCFVSGDILFARMRPALRKVCLINDDIDEGFASSECLVLTPKSNPLTGEPLILPELLTLLLRSDLVYGQVIHLVTGIGRPRLSTTAILNIRLPVPPLDEQTRLLNLYHRSDSIARSLVTDSERALQSASQIMADAGRALVDDILSPDGV